MYGFRIHEIIQRMLHYQRFFLSKCLRIAPYEYNSTRFLRTLSKPSALSLVRSKKKDTLPTTSSPTLLHPILRPPEIKMVTPAENRSRVKLANLIEAKTKLESSKMRLLRAMQDKSTSINYDTNTLQSEYNQRQEELSTAYSQAIQYLVRTREQDSASRAQGLLYEMIQRAIPNTTGDAHISTKLTHKKEYDHEQYILLLQQVLNDIASPKKETSSLKSEQLLTSNYNDTTFQTLPTPTHKDFHNVINAWAFSKAKKKGFMALDLLSNMTQLTQILIEHKMNTNILLLPDTKALTLAIKCFATSTYPHAFQKVLEIHHIHHVLLNCQEIPSTFRTSLIKNDIPFLIYSIKCIKNFKKRNETTQMLQWLKSLTTQSILQVPETEDHVVVSPADPNDSSLTSMFNNIIRGFFHIRGEPGVADKLVQVVDHMHTIHQYQQDRSKQGKLNERTIQLKQNAYNMILASYGYAKDYKYITLGLNMLDTMIQAWKSPDTSFYPLPNDQSFVYGFGLLRHGTPTDKVRSESHRLLHIYEAMMDTPGRSFSDPSPKVYNAVLDLYTHTMDGPEVLSSSLVILDRMKERAKVHVEYSPDISSWTLLIKACSLASSDDYIQNIRAQEFAMETFTKLSQGQQSSKMTDSIYFYMMKCIAAYTADPLERQTAIVELFDQACQRGFLSANVLRIFKMNVPLTVCAEKLGHGRLADKWIINVTSEKALYTDGTMGGEGKNARRKGKSTSNHWLKNRAEPKVHGATRKKGTGNPSLQKRNRSIL